MSMDEEDRLEREKKAQILREFFGALVEQGEFDGIEKIEILGKDGKYHELPVKKEGP